jgi:hypothetical protein
MKIARVTCFLFVLLLSLVAFAFTTSTPRAHAASGTTTVFRFHGLSVMATFISFSSDGCIGTVAFVDSSQNTVNNQTSSEADIFINQDDICANKPLLEAAGFTLSPTFQLDKNLLSASLNTTISVFDVVSQSAFNVSVNLTWTSTSAITHEHSTFHFHTKALTENGHANADFRDAVASGTVSDAMTANFTPSPSVSAQTMSAKEVDVTITHP